MSELVLGWQLTQALEPKYWLNRDAKPGSQSSHDLVTVSPASVAAHTAIIAQSGSGKSFFLGRFVEEIALQTKARCIVLDPNADFRRIHEVESPTLWENANYNIRKRAGKLPHEATREEFAARWVEVEIRIRGGDPGGIRPYEPLRLSWPSVAAEFLAEDLGPLQKGELYHCHSFVKIVHDLFALRSLTQRSIRDYLKKAETLLNQAIANPSDFATTIKEELGIADVEHTDVDQLKVRSLFSRLGLKETSKRDVARAVDQQVDRALTAARYLSGDIRRFYFGKLNEFRTAGIIDTRAAAKRSGKETPARIEVIDLPSIGHPTTRLLAINAVIETEWERARVAWDIALRESAETDFRVPTFIVIDEAHNVVPRDPRSRTEHALREQFRTIIAEGRKYGLFLILVSQRPDKLDPLVVSECENRAIMKLSSGSALKATKEMLALEDVSDAVLNKCLDLPIGRALLVGHWSPDGPDFVYAAARRTVEGGRNLKTSYWASPPEPKPVPAPDSSP